VVRRGDVEDLLPVRRVDVPDEAVARRIPDLVDLDRVADVGDVLVRVGDARDRVLEHLAPDAHVDFVGVGGRRLRIDAVAVRSAGGRERLIELRVAGVELIGRLVGRGVGDGGYGQVQ